MRIKNYFVFIFITLSSWFLSFQCVVNANDYDLQKICLIIHIKNNESTIEECLKSVKDIVDCIYVYDCGSKDKTIKLIERFGAENGLPRRYSQPAAISSERPKIQSLQPALNFLKELQFSLSTTYFLILDPEMVLKIGPSFSKQALQKDAYAFLEKSSSLAFYSYHTHLLRASLKWKNIGYDRWIANEDCMPTKLKSLTAEEIGNEKLKASRLQQNLGFIIDNLKNDPSNKQLIFHRALLHRGLKEFDEAIVWFNQRIEQEEMDDEVWFSKYMLGECYEETGDWEQAIKYYLEAYQHDPKRAESLRKIATHYRLIGQNDLSYIFAKHGSRVSLPMNRSIYSASVHDYQFDEELSISAYYTQFANEGMEASNNLVIRRNVPWFIRDQSYRNMMFYIQKLKNTQFTTISLDLPLIVEGSKERYKPMNPSLVKTSTGYQLICRSVNYTQSGAKIFDTIDPHGIYRTRNFLLEYDKDFNLLKQQEIIENLPRERLRNLVEGLEDCRLIEVDKSLWFTCTTSDTNPTGTRQISLCKLEEQPRGEKVYVEKLIPLNGPDPFRCEKNWVPFMHNKEVSVIYSYDPFIVYKPNIDTGDCEKVLEYQPKCNFSHFRGSAAPIPLDNGYLMLVHEVVIQPDFTRVYLHRFLFLDKDFVMQKFSKPFIFQHEGIEFCCSMTWDHTGEKLVMPIGIEDREAYLCFVDVETVRNLLEPLPSLPELNLEN